MSQLTLLSDPELIAMLSAAVRTETAASVEVITHLAELDRRKLYLQEACSSLFKYCVDRLGYSEDSAVRRVRVARAAERWPRVLEELASGAIHLTGLVLLSEHLSDENADALLDEARGLSKRQLQELLARRFPRSSAPARIVPEHAQMDFARAGHGNSPAPVPVPVPAPAPALASQPPRIEPAAPLRYRLEFSISAEFRDKLERLQNLTSHAVPSGSVAELLERAVDDLLAKETKRRLGAGKPRKRRLTEPGSRHIPVEDARAVHKRDSEQCAFVDAQGRRCSEKRFLEFDHHEPHALGGPPTQENLRLFCSAHNAMSARQVFGEEHVQRKIVESVHARVLAALVGMGFKRAQAKRALEEIEARVEPRAEPMLRAAVAALTPV